MAHDHEKHNEAQHEHLHCDGHCECCHHGEEEDRGSLILRLCISAVLVILAILTEHVFQPAAPYGEILTGLLCAVACLLCGLGVFQNTVKSLLHGEIFDENFLMALAAVGAFCVGEFVEGAAVMVLFQLGEMLQDMAVDKSRDAIAALTDIRPDHANVEKDGQVIRALPREVAPGDIIVVRAGDRIPLDGVIISGASSLNTAALTGESMPVDVGQGDAVQSGCVNISGLLRVRVEKAYQDSTVSRILALVENANEHRASTDRFITRFARVYTPIVVLCAVLLAVIPSLFDGQWAEWIHRALTFLVVSCPCALVISVPLTFFSGIGTASRRGILIKGAVYMEKLAAARIMAFDKTGTLTRGEFAVTAIHPEGMSEDELLTLAASAEAYSTHPIAESLKKAAGSSLSPANDVQELAGYGLSATVMGSRVLVGNEKLMRENGIQPLPNAYPGTVIYVAKGAAYAGCIVIEDTLKDGAKEAMDALREQGVEKLCMISGDRAASAEATGRKLALDEIHSGLSPEEKARVMSRLTAEALNATAAYVGDGINDAPVLTIADCGIAMGGMGSDAAIESADIVLMDDDLKKLPSAIRICRGTLHIARQNILFALFAKVAVLVLSAFGLTPMWLAVFADVGVCLLAIANAMRAMRLR